MYIYEALPNDCNFTWISDSNWCTGSMHRYWACSFLQIGLSQMR